MISPLKKKDSFHEILNSEPFFLLVKPTQSIYTNSFERDFVEQEIELLTKAGFINLEISWSNNENWLNYVSNLRLKFPKLHLGSASIDSKKAIDESVNIGLKYSMMKVWDKNLLNYSKSKRLVLTRIK